MKPSTFRDYAHADLCETVYVGNLGNLAHGTVSTYLGIKASPTSLQLHL